MYNQKLDDSKRIFNFKKWNRDRMLKKYENKLEMKEIRKQVKGSSVIRE